jgi:hypothetical protein
MDTIESNTDDIVVLITPPLTQSTALTMDGTVQRLYIANRDDSSTGRVFVVNSQTAEQLQICSPLYLTSAQIIIELLEYCIFEN